MGIKEEYADKERAAWQEFMDAVERVPDGRGTEPGVVPGWSVKDLIVHNGGWARWAAEELEKAGDGPFADPFDTQDEKYWDDMSQRQIDEAAELTFDQVMWAAEEDRDRVHAVWESLEDPDSVRADFFAGETFQHYPDHTQQIDRWLAEQ
jgi:hypothetical protein